MTGTTAGRSAAPAGRLSAGILLYRLRPTGVEVWIAHMGGPFWARKHERAWSIPKGLVEPGEDARAAALREFAEETGVPAPSLVYDLLAEAHQRSGKVVRAYTAELPAGDDETVIFAGSNMFTLEWPRGSGVLREFPEIDAARWVPLGEARRLVVAGQEPLLDALQRRLGLAGADPGPSSGPALP